MAPRAKAKTKTKLNQSDLNIIIDQARKIAMEGREPRPFELKKLIPNKRNALYTEACRQVRNEMKEDDEAIQTAPNELIIKVTEIATRQAENIATQVAKQTIRDIWLIHQEQLDKAKSELEQFSQEEITKAFDAVDQANKNAELAQQLAEETKKTLALAEAKAAQYLDINEKLNQDVQQKAAIIEQQNNQIAALTAQLESLTTALQQLAEKPNTQKTETPINQQQEPEPEIPTPEPAPALQTETKTKTKRSKTTTKTAKKQAEEQPAQAEPPAKPKRRTKATKAQQAEPAAEPTQEPILSPLVITKQEPQPAPKTKTRAKRTPKDARRVP